MIKIGILLTKPFYEKKKDELVVCNSRHRPWLRKTPKKYCIPNRKNKICCAGDVSTGMYIKEKHNVDVDFIFPEEVTLERLKQNTVNFMLIYDILEAFHNSNTPKKKKQYENFVKTLKQAKNVYPPYSYQNLINDKSKYINHLSKKRIKMIPTFKVTREKYGKNKREQIIKFILNKVKKSKWKDFIAKPIYGQESIGFKKFSMENENVRQELDKYLQKMFKSCKKCENKCKVFPGILIQKYIDGFDKANPEIRLYFFDEQYKYSVITNDTDVSIPKNEKGTTTVHNFNKLRDAAKKTMKALPDIKIKGIKLPRLLTRVDISCQDKFKKPWIVNEVEFVPSLYIEDVNTIPEISLGDAMVKIAKKLL